MGFEIRMKRRREDRISVILPVRIFGIDSQGKPFNIRTETVDVTRLGARLHNVNCFSKAGEVVGLQYEEKKARFRVCWVGLPGTPKEGDIGVQLMESDRPIWDIAKVRCMPGAKKQEGMPEVVPTAIPGMAPGFIPDEREKNLAASAGFSGPGSSSPSLFAVQGGRAEVARPAPQPEIIRGYSPVAETRSEAPVSTADG